ncbi:MAG: hypothetical protein ACI853_001354 [Paracoccaceae bacterium]
MAAVVPKSNGCVKMVDATFEEGAESPLYLSALDDSSLKVISALLQDAVFTGSDMRYDPKDRSFALLLNRFRWEDRENAQKRRRAYERVRAIVRFADILRVGSQGIDRADKDLVLSLLDIAFEAGEDGTGRIVLTLAGDGAIALEVECLDVTLRDVTRPYAAISGKLPMHPELSD